MRLNGPAQSEARRHHSGFTVAEVVVATTILVVGYVGLYGAMAWGRTMVKNSRENLRATEVMDEKMEQIRLYDWQEITNNVAGGYMNPAPFAQYYDPLKTNEPPVYWCRMIVGNVPSTYPSSYNDSMRLVTVVVLWTNYNGGSSITTHARTNQTYVARYGMQNYVFGGTQ